MPGRSPHRRPTPPPPLISHHSPARGRRSPDRHNMEMTHSRSRERREYRPVVRRSRSPQPKGRSFSPPLKRKASPSREREVPRRPKTSKSPVDSRSLEHTVYSTAETENIIRNVANYDRLRSKGSEGVSKREESHFRGPVGEVNINDKHSLKKFTIEIVRKPSGPRDDSHVNRSIINTDEIVPVRRPDLYAEDFYYYDKGQRTGMRGSQSQRGQFVNRHYPPPRWSMREDASIPINNQNEGTRPLFLQTVATSSSKDRSIPREDYKRIVNINTSSRVTETDEQERSHERVRYSPRPYEDNRRPYYRDRESSPYESHRHSPPREKYEPLDKTHIIPQERRGNSKEEMRPTESRRREERRYSPERHSYEKESDLRLRINEKRIDSHVRPEEREHSSRRYDVERERPSRSHHSSPPREKRRTGSTERHEGSRNRGEAWEREREGERRKRARSHEREERGRDRDRFERSETYEGTEKNRRPQTYKTDYESKKFYSKNYEESEFVPPPMRGRGGLPIRRGIPPMIRGRGVPRGFNRGFRGGMMVGIPRGVPRAPFMGMRGFPPRFFPPY